MICRPSEIMDIQTKLPNTVNMLTIKNKNWSLWLDIVILFKTIKVVLRREGAY